jgi:hypothetical protein
LERRGEYSKTEKIKSAWANIVVEPATTWFCVIKVLGSNLNKEIVYPERDFFHVFPQSIQTHAMTVFEFRQDSGFPYVCRPTTPTLPKPLIAILNES